MVKLIGQMAEKARIGIRNVRESVMKEIKRAEADGKNKQRRFKRRAGRFTKRSR